MRTADGTDSTDTDSADTLSPFPTVSNGRGPDGRFQPGNPGGPGSTYAKQVAALRAALMEAARPEAMREVVAQVVTKAKEGHLPAIRELFDRTLGRPVEADLIARIEQVEERLARASEGGSRG